MKWELANYEIYPKILKAGEMSSITIRPLGRHAAFADGNEYLIRFLPMDESLEPMDMDDEAYDSIAVKPENGVLNFRYTFRGEQEYYVRLFRKADMKRLGNFSVFSLEPDLYCRRPFRGDFHVHTFHSDGKEAPEIVAANYRKNGFDFLAITDHHKWRPSLEAIDAYKDLPVDLKLFKGEEIHPPRNHIHMVNFGGNFSVNELFENDPQSYESEVAEIMKTVKVPQGVSAYEYASCIWCFDKIRQGGGLGIFCHPHWIANVYHVPEKMVDYLFETKPFDAFELLGGHEVYSNNMQTAYYNEARAKGIKVPIVGASDSHGTEDSYWFTWLSTIVFSQDNQLQSIIDAVKGFYSVAVERYPGENYRIYGPYRLVKYALFLLNEYFPLHDALCYEEGRLMKDYICGDENAKEILKLMQGRTARLLERCFNG